MDQRKIKALGELLESLYPEERIALAEELTRRLVAVGEVGATEGYRAFEQTRAIMKWSGEKEMIKKTIRSLSDVHVGSEAWCRIMEELGEWGS